MAGKWGRQARGRTGRSAELRIENAAMTEVMKAWEGLSDEERLPWRLEGESRRMHGINYFKKINLRRLLRGEELARVPPPSKPYDGKPVLKRLRIGNRGGRITLILEFGGVPTGPTTVWGARPCNRGAAKPDKCPRLGWLPPPKDGVSNITELYFMKHGEYIQQSGMQLEGKRIFIRIRREEDGGKLVRRSQGGGARARGAVGTSKKAHSHRNSTETPSKLHRNIALTTPEQPRSNRLSPGFEMAVFILPSAFLSQSAESNIRAFLARFLVRA